MAIKKYPHLLPQEVKIWDQFMARYGDDYDRFEYDVHVGDIPTEFNHLVGNDLHAVKSIYRARIDVIGFRGNDVTIFEIKPQAGLSAYGQILGYMSMYEAEFSPAGELRGAIVTNIVSSPAKKLFVDAGFLIFIFPVA